MITPRDTLAFRRAESIQAFDLIFFEFRSSTNVKGRAVVTDGLVY
jgi:hypothetical protein